jgi:hypothetical protein
MNELVGILNCEPQYFNTALAQIVEYEQSQGNICEQYDHLNNDGYARVYASSLFERTDKSMVPEDAIKGGTGFNVLSRLKPEIEACGYAYNFFPKCKCSYVWFSRGCPRNCGFCVVPRKEGGIKPVTPKPLNPNGEYIIVNDNNFFANPEWPSAIKQLQEWGQPVCIQQGVDWRTLNEETCKAILTLKHVTPKGKPGGQIHIAWDDPRDDPVPKLKEIFQWIKPYRLACYVLIGYNSTEEQDIYRVETLRSLGVDPFAMVYDGRRDDQRLKDFGKWVDRKELFNSCSWIDFKTRNDRIIDEKQAVLIDV